MQLAIWLFLGSLIAIGAFLFSRWEATRIPVAWVAITIGLSVFAIRLSQPGAYATPEGGNLFSGLLALGFGAVLLPFGSKERKPPSPLVWLQRLVLAASPIVLFLALYSTLAELEEVVVLHATHRDGRPIDLRLWIVDDEDGGWIQMPLEKAEDHHLSEIRMDMTRDAVRSCIEVKRFSDVENTRRVQALRYEKYLVQRLATIIGIFKREPTGNAVVLRITPCAAP